MFGFMVQRSGIDPLICTNDAILILFSLSCYTKICSVSTKLAAFPSLSSPLVTNRLPGLLQSFLEIRLKSIFDLFTLGELIKTYPKMHGILKGEYSYPWNSERMLSLKAK